MENKYCKNCVHFFQHYTLGYGKIFQVYCGHCVHPKIRQKKPDSPACPRFAPGPADEYAFVTKEYLSKELLRYMLNLELLPPIEAVEES